VSIRLVLDVSALLGYAGIDTALAVGEIIREVREGEGDDQVAIPASAFLAAYTATDEAGRALLANILADVELARLRQDPHQSVFAVLPLTSKDITDVGNLELSWPGRGQAIVESLRHDAILATFEPCQEASPRLDIVDLGTGWADDDTGWHVTDSE
jgi:hypothetical protein